MAPKRTYTDEALVVATYDVLRARGPASLSLRPIAKRLGVSEPGLLKRIGSKARLLELVQAWATQQLRTLLVELEKQADPINGLRWLFRVHAKQSATPRVMAHLLSFSALCLNQPTLRSHVEARHELLTNAIAKTLRRDGRAQPELVARTLVALLDGVALSWAIRQDGSLEHQLVSSLDLVLGAGRHT